MLDEIDWGVEIIQFLAIVLMAISWKVNFQTLGWGKFLLGAIGFAIAAALNSQV